MPREQEIKPAFVVVIMAILHKFGISKTYAEVEGVVKEFFNEQ